MKSYLTEFCRRLPKDRVSKEDQETVVKMARIRESHGMAMEGDAQLLAGEPLNQLNTTPSMETTYELLKDEYPTILKNLPDDHYFAVVEAHKKTAEEREQASEWARLEKENPKELMRIMKEDPDRYDKMVEEFVTVTRKKGKSQRKSAFD